MKRVWWVFRIAVLVAAIYCIFAPSGLYTMRSAQAYIDGAGCETSTVCQRRQDNNRCYCPDATIGGNGCNGCYVPNNDPGCGTCSSGGNFLPEESAQ